MKKFKIMMLLCALIFSVSFIHAKDINVVIFLTKKGNYKSALKQANGLSKSIVNNKENGDIELVLGGSAVEIFTDKNNELRNEVINLSQKPHVRILVCNGALNARKLNKSIIPENIKVINAAPREVVDRQLEGYAILNP
ncbi:DsrE family protein [Campylobacter sp. LR286c]|uniref:DsrE family protein n=1 Tax=Campylobacter sp. LR286c TaxID=2593545 RepID=UPI001237DD09|nr:DsrE family protein [Campylobacter sp. LR286c]KAA6226068.1 hypothetical protein FMM57_06645 [Campylobacter sp. LR286c]